LKEKLKLNDYVKRNNYPELKTIDKSNIAELNRLTVLMRRREKSLPPDDRVRVTEDEVETFEKFGK